MKVLFAMLFILSGCSTLKKASYTEAPTKFLEANGTRYAYRIIGKKSEVPLVALPHFRASMDNWDPKLLDEVAKERTVIVFDNKGVSSTTGVTPDSFKAMGDDAAEFIQALGYKKVDILGFSIGGAVAQEILHYHPDLVRRAILASTSPQSGKGLNTRDPKIIAIATKPVAELNDFLTLFFGPSTTSQKAGSEFLERRKTFLNPEPASSEQTMMAQGKARFSWGEDVDPTYARIKTIKHPVLVANGNNDIMMPTINSYILFQNIPNAQLQLYPDSGHGFLFQYPELFATQITMFLDKKYEL